MWAAKLPGEGAALADACAAMVAVMAALGVAVDGGKDSLSMAARVGSETVRAPGMAWGGPGESGAGPAERGWHLTVSLLALQGRWSSRPMLSVRTSQPP